MGQLQRLILSGKIGGCDFIFELLLEIIELDASTVSQ